MQSTGGANHLSYRQGATISGVQQSSYESVANDSIIARRSAPSPSPHNSSIFCHHEDPCCCALYRRCPCAFLFFPETLTLPPSPRPYFFAMRSICCSTASWPIPSGEARVITAYHVLARSSVGATSSFIFFCHEHAKNGDDGANITSHAMQVGFGLVVFHICA